MRSRRVLDALLKEETRKLNLHLPRERKTLDQLLAEDAPSVKTADGSEIIMNWNALEKFAQLTPPHLWRKVRLPIVLMRRLDLGKSVFVVLGDDSERSIVKQMWGIADADM